MTLLVMRRGGLGDTLLMLPLLRALRRAHEGSALHFAGVREFAEVFVAYGVVDAVHSVEDFALWQPEVARGRLAGFEAIYGDVPEFATAALDPRALTAGEPAGLQLARQAGVSPRWPEDAWLLAPRAAVGTGPTVVAPGSGGRAKCWPRERWLALVGALPQPCTVVVGPVEIERDDPRAWPWPVGTRFFADGSVVELAELLRTARCYVGNDSGTTHLAAMLGVPTVAIFGPSDPSVWAPVGPHVEVLGGQGASVDVAAVAAAYGKAARTRCQ